MSMIADAVTSHLELLHTNRELIAQIYTEGQVIRSEENSKRLNQLEQVRAIRANAALQDSYRLSPTLSRLLDEATHKTRSYSVSADFGEQMDRMKKLMDDYSAAHFDGREEDRDVILSEFDVSVFDVSEDMKDFLLHVRTAAENNFANVRTYKEKEKQNQHYLDQLDRIVKAFVAFDLAAFLDELNQPERESLAELYERHILANLSKWRATCNDITSVLKVYLHKLRTVEPRAKRIRALQMHLRRHPEYEARDPDEYPEIPEWAYQHDPMKIRLSPDLGRQEIRDSLVDVARSIEIQVITPPKQRTPGALIKEDAPKAAIIKGSPLVVVAQRLLNEASKSLAPISAADYFALTEETRGLDQESCMMCFLTVLDRQVQANTKIIRRLQIDKKIKNAHDRMSGNVIIEDVQVCKRSA
ncbi:hypothetical protein [Pseudomonas sp. MWU13-2100]|uniref:hypothetical protein n=1 Tax=Pseudomonas sp. MWU13-2100 TaxID=2935075 RepID=UPI00200C6C5C|nr:hypothetical protein [Pseudomonas sp. MWU13-2100]